MSPFHVSTNAPRETGRRSIERSQWRPDIDAVLGADGKRYAIGSGAEKRIRKHLELRADGLTVRDIAAITGWSSPTVWRDVTRYELAPESAA